MRESALTQHEYQQPGVVEVFRQHFPTRIRGMMAEIRKRWGAEVPIIYWLVSGRDPIGF